MSSRTTNNSKFRDKLFLSPQQMFLIKLIENGPLPVSKIVDIGSYDKADRVNTHGKLDGQLSQLISLGIVARTKVLDEHLNRWVFNYGLESASESVVSDTKSWYKSFSGAELNTVEPELNRKISNTTSSSVFRGNLFLSPHQFLISELLSYFESLSITDLVGLGNYDKEKRNTAVRIEEQLRRLEDLGVVEKTEGIYEMTEYGSAVVARTIRWFEGKFETEAVKENVQYRPEDQVVENRVGM